jgi:hypothetical protein
MGSYFQTKKEPRHGDPLPPILFNIVADMLAIIISRAKDAGQVKGVVPRLVEDGLSILHIDGTVIFMDHDIKQANKMKLLLRVFEQLSGLKINFYNSEIFCFGQAQQFEAEHSRLFGR